MHAFMDLIRKVLRWVRIFLWIKRMLSWNLMERRVRMLLPSNEMTRYIDENKDIIEDKSKSRISYSREQSTHTEYIVGECVSADLLHCE